MVNDVVLPLAAEAESKAGYSLRSRSQPDTCTTQKADIKDSSARTAHATNPSTVVSARCTSAACATAFVVDDDPLSSLSNFVTLDSDSDRRAIGPLVASNGNESADVSLQVASNTAATESDDAVMLLDAGVDTKQVNVTPICGSVGQCGSEPAASLSATKSSAKDTDEPYVDIEPCDQSCSSDESDVNADPATFQGAKAEIVRIIKLFKGLDDQYQLVKKIGEGTFSSVYKAVDIHRSTFDDAHRRGKTRHVAVKRIYVSSSPDRIMNEIAILLDLRDRPGIVPIISAFRDADQVALIFPYFRHRDFRDYYSNMTNAQLRAYMRGLFVSLKSIHECGIMHRDIKPSNFLYNEKARQGMLVDFGLAQRQTPPPARRGEPNEVQQQIKIDEQGMLRVRIDETKPPYRANRAGTRGFRAPEVLLKVSSQTTAIDIWSAGVIMLCVLARRFPFFQSSMDQEALAEIACLFGAKAMANLASRYDRIFETNIPSVQDSSLSIDRLCRKLRGESPDFSQDAFNLLEKCLVLHPVERITASEALSHPYICNE